MEKLSYYISDMEENRRSLSRVEGAKNKGQIEFNPLPCHSKVLSSSAVDDFHLRHEFMNEPILTFRQAVRDDLERIVQLLADDELGKTREDFSLPLPSCYEHAFEAISADRNNELIVAEQAGKVVGVLQLTFIPYLTLMGSSRALIEGVRVASEKRGCGIGRQMLRWAIVRARERQCRVVQLTTNKSRANAIRFYESLGFVASHEGMKLQFG